MSERAFNDDDQDIRSQLSEDSGYDDLDIDKTLEGLEEEEETGLRSRGAGTDQVLERLRKTDPEAARVVGEMQRKMSQNINEWTDLRSEVLSLREQLLSRLEGNEEETDIPREHPLPEGVTPEHIELFKTMADHLGYVPRSELQERDREDSATSYVQSDLRRAVEEFGEEFGTVGRDGSVVLNPAIQERLNARLTALSDPKRGVTPRDLFLLEFGGRASRTPSRRRDAGGTSSKPSGNVVRRSTGGGGRVRIYDPKRGDSRDDVFERAAALAKRELSR